ncbi:hypothetical protein ACWDBF_21055 [Streptomyces angustmyceticus]
MPETGYQPQLFDDSEIVGSGKPRPWTALIQAADEQPAGPPQAEQLPLDDSDEMRSAA